MWTLCAYNLDSQFSSSYLSLSEKPFSQLKSMNMAEWYSGEEKGPSMGRLGYAVETFASVYPKKQ